MGIPLSPATRQRVDLLFDVSSRAEVEQLLTRECGSNLPFCQDCDMHQLERVRFAALKYSLGDVALLREAIQLAKEDWRDVLLAAGFADDIDAHSRWFP